MIILDEIACFNRIATKCDRLYKNMNIQGIIACFNPITKSAIAFTRI
ncbi:hypothetical protein [Brasilonema sp. UFV-L1]|nr:hypothetical protein [Brasilonema sp. UFV-L1]